MENQVGDFDKFRMSVKIDSSSDIMSLKRGEYMKYTCTMLAVRDIERSRKFYHDILDCDTVYDFGTNITLTGGFSLQTLDTWTGFIEKNEEEITLGHNAGELYFEEENMDAFLKKLDEHKEIKYVHPFVEHRWGQRVVRFYDPDMNIIEVGETLNAVARRFSAEGMTVEQVAERMEIPVDYAKTLL